MSDVDAVIPKLPLGCKAELVLVRGLPGSGKSTLARDMKGHVHIETDMFFTDSEGVYRFDPDALRVAHSWCQHQVRMHLRDGHDVVVSNTFTRAWEMKPYFDMGYPVRVLTCNGRWPNVHGVPQETIDRMAERWEPVELVDYL